MKKISFTIVTPVYNRSDTLQRCIESVRSQDIADFEHIIVDDGSTDGSFDVAESYALVDSRIKVFRFAVNKGTNAARNLAIENATKSYVIILDSDDYFVKNALRIIAEAINNNINYRHYLFAADDMMQSYKENKLLNKNKNILLYRQWLNREVSGDFIHVVERDLMCAFPFNEFVRIYEGTNFLRIYRHGKKQLFVKEIVTIRERGRSDSVTLTAALKSKGAIERSYHSVLQRLEWFANDMRIYNLYEILRKDCHVAIKLGLALGEYSNVREFCLHKNVKMDLLESIIYRVRLGNLLRFTIVLYYRFLSK